jgi:hypothetical protein
MSVYISKIANSQTFGTWLARTNQTIAVLSTNAVTTDNTVIGGFTNGNGTVNGYFGANTLFAINNLRGGNVTSSNTLTVTTNTTFNFVNSTGSQGSIENGIPAGPANLVMIFANSSAEFGDRTNVHIYVNTSIINSTSNAYINSGNLIINTVKNTYCTSNNLLITTTSNAGIVSNTLTVQSSNASVNSNFLWVNTISNTAINSNNLNISTVSNASIVSNTLTVQSVNAAINSSNLTITTIANAGIISNTLTVRSTNAYVESNYTYITSNNNVLTGNLYINSSSTYTVLNIDAPSNTVQVNATSVNVASNTKISGTNTIILSNTYITGSNLVISETNTFITSDVTITGTSSIFNSNVEINAATATNVISTTKIHSTNLYVDSANSNFDSYVYINNKLKVVDSANLISTLGVGGAANLISTLGVGGVANLFSTVGVNGAVTIANTLDVSRDITASQNVAVTGTIKSGANVTANNTTIRVGNTVVNAVISNNTLYIGNTNYTILQSANVIIATDTINITNHGYVTGDRIYYNNGGDTPIAISTISGPSTLSSSSVYFVRKIENNSFKLYDTYLNATTIASTTGLIDLTGQGTDTQYFSPYSSTGAYASINSIAIVTPGYANVNNLYVTNKALVGNLEVTGTLIYGGTTSGSFTPSANLTYDLGTTALYWSNSYIGKGFFSKGIEVAADASNSTFNTNLLYIDTTNSRVGVGTSTPSYKLQVSGAIGANNIVVAGGTVNSSFNTSLLFIDAVNSRVGVSNTAPGSKFTVAGVIETTTGGIKFPDGTTQTTATVSTGATPPGGSDTQIQYNSSSTFGGSAGLIFTVASNTVTVGNTVNTRNVIFANATTNVAISSTNTYTFASGAAAIVDAFAAATYRSVEYTIQLTSGSNYQMTKILGVHNGTDTFITEYGSISNSTTPVGTFTAGLASGNFNLSCTPVATGTVLKIFKTSITV